MHRGWNVREGVECTEGGVYDTLERGWSAQRVER